MFDNAQTEVRYVIGIVQSHRDRVGSGEGQERRGREGGGIMVRPLFPRFFLVHLILRATLSRRFPDVVSTVKDLFARNDP